CGGDGGGGSPPSGPGTVAYIETSCRQDGPDMTLQQDVRILHGDAPSVTAMSVGPLGPFTSLLCATYGSNRYSMRDIGPVKRFGITPDGSGVAFEVTDVFIRDPGWVLAPGQAGIYYTRADGSGLRRLGPPSRSPATFYTPSGVLVVNDFSLSFDPSGQQFTYTDRGPDEAGHDAAQVFVQGLMPGARSRQVTRLPALDLPGQWPEITVPSFIDSRTILFSRWIQPGTERTWLTVDIDTNQVNDLPTVALPGGELIPIYQITGEDWIGLIGTLKGEPENPFADSPIREVVVTDGTNVLQLTNFRRVDTVLTFPFYSARDRRVYFSASFNPRYDPKRSENCQIFSIAPRGGDLRQLPFFRERAAHATDGCFGNRRGTACSVLFGHTSHASQNPHTGEIFFRSN